MEKENKTKQSSGKRIISGAVGLAIGIAVVFALVLAISFFGNSAFTRSVSDINTAHIEELAAHDIKIINYAIGSRLDTLEQVGADIAYNVKKGTASVADTLHRDAEFLPKADRITLVSEDGTVCSSNNVVESRPDIAAVCFAQSDRFVQRFDNVADILPDTRREFVLYGVRIKPVEFDGHTYEYLCAFIKPARLENELVLESYTGEGFGSVIDSEGNYVLNINRSHSFLARDNFFKDFQNVENYVSVDEFHAVFTASGAQKLTARAMADFGTGTYEEYYLVFTPMDGIDWCYVSAVPAKVLEEQSETLMEIAGILLAVVVLAVIILAVFLQRSRRQQEKLREKEMTDELNDRLQRQQIALEEALDLAQSANRAKTTFLNNMSHDIRTPMNAIIGYTGLASSHIDNKEQVQEYLSKIGQSSDHLLSLINDVLDMSRIESGKVAIDEKEEDLGEILHTLRNIVQADIHNKQLELYMDTEVNDQFVICDKLRLNQVLLNVLSNSIKYTQPGGMVSVRVKENSVSETGYGRYEFRIKDNGMGMSEEFLKTIFEPFTRMKSSTVSGIQGTGLGMAITKNIIDMMGGTIDVRSREGEGTETIMSFDFKLAGEKSEPVRIVALEGLKSLVVDDDVSACQSISRMLHEAGMKSDWCTSGKEAVIRTEEAVRYGERFKVYIIDWLMPDMNGIETTRRIRQIVGDDAPIIVLTAYDWADIEEEAKEAGVTAFISKPLFPSDLHNVLNRCCGNLKEEKVTKPEYDFTGKKILLVEDNEMNREIAQEILEEDGFVVDMAEDGAVAVGKMKAAGPGRYDLILMDIQMPVMDGYEATKAIRALPDPAAANITIIAMTANAFEEDRKLAMEAGMNEHLAKPINTEKLKETLAKFLKE